MNITIPNENDKTKTIKANLYHDIDGNVYLKLDNAFFALFINTDDDIEFIEMTNYNSLPKVEQNISYSKIRNTYEKNSLKGKIIKELEETNYNEEEDEIENEGYYTTKYKSYPEDKLFTVEDETTNNDNHDGDDDLNEKYENYYKFSKTGDKDIISCLDRTLDVLANYDTFIINDGDLYVLGALQGIEKSPYRISFFTSGKITLNIVGTKIKLYDLEFQKNNDEILIKSKIVKTNINL